MPAFMVVFFYIGFYLMPFIGYMFIVYLLRAIKKIVNNESYVKELRTAGLVFAIIVWTICMLVIGTSA